MTLDVAIPIFDGITALDAIGPCEVLSWLPEAHVHFVGPQPPFDSGSTSKASPEIVEPARNRS